ncbi:MAG: dehydrogenase [Candidatus Riflebacteria bacterium HGW-Riflebacteria-1]|jgi:xanthine dehydrogenase accessory factor|nr:MAG: dehydrogenase [Candidatus Riflebacteria bacterium HGW-Riflebacteria-1]
MLFMATEFFYELKQAFNRNEPFVLCTVVETIGSSPGTVGQKMIVRRDGSTAGTVGGGINEERTRKAALDLFSCGGSLMLTYDLANPLEGGEPVCGGKSRVFIELQAHEPRMVIFGGGHIGRVLAKMAVLARFRVTLADERPEYANPELFPECVQVICKPFEEAVAEAGLDKNCHVTVLTPGHRKDFEVLEKVLPSEAAYVGLVCSAKKLVEMKQALVEKTVEQKRVDALFAPIGINLGSTTPEEIAVEILAQIVAFRNGKVLRFEK